VADADEPLACTGDPEASGTLSRLVLPPSSRNAIAAVSVVRARPRLGRCGQHQMGGADSGLTRAAVLLLEHHELPPAKARPTPPRSRSARRWSRARSSSRSEPRCLTSVRSSPAGRGQGSPRSSASTSAPTGAPTGIQPGCLAEPAERLGALGVPVDSARLGELHAPGARHRLGPTNPGGGRTVQHARLPVLGNRQAAGHGGELARDHAGCAWRAG